MLAPGAYFAILRNPDRRLVAESLELTTTATHELYDLVIVGAGPAGLASAVYGASEGMRTLLLDEHGPGGQAGSSSRIENYLGFPAGISGSELTRRAVAQAQRLGAEFRVPVTVTGLCADGGYKRIAFADGREIAARAVILATGMTYREHPAQGIGALSGAGVYYGAAATEARSCAGQRVVVVGGGNSAGQAAVYLSRFATEVSDWLPPSLLRDAKGFVPTGRDALSSSEFAKIWKEDREPTSLETSIPGVFAAGDVRAGAMNRVASAVGEGAIAVKPVVDYLARH